MHAFSVSLNYQFNFEKHVRRHVKFQFEKRQLDRQKETGRAYRIFSQNVTKNQKGIIKKVKKRSV